MQALLSLQPAVLSFAGYDWTRPWGLAALSLPLVILWWSRRREPPREEASGAFALWASLAARAGAPSARERRGPPPRLLWLLAALVLVALALAGPRRPTAAARAAWTVLLDRSPSMYLPRVPGDGRPRIARAVERARAWLDEHGVVPEARGWSDGQGTRVAGAGPPDTWLQAPRAPRGEPRWERFDEPGWLWVTDRVPSAEAREASWLALGGEAIPGPLGAGLRWDGERLLPNSGGAPRRAVARELAEPLEELLAVWCEERGLTLGGDPEGAQLVVRGAGGSSARVQAAGRDGWRIVGEWSAGGAPRSDELGALEEWLAPGLVSAGPGRVHVALGAVSSLEGDPASFAFSWSRLFDQTCLAAPGVVALSQRRAAGEGGSRLGALPDEPTDRSDEPRLEAWLLLAALVLAGVWAAGLGSSRAPRSELRNSEPAG